MAWVIRQMLECGSPQAVIAQSHISVAQSHTEWCMPVQGVVRFDQNGADGSQVGQSQLKSPTTESKHMHRHLPPRAVPAILAQQLLRGSKLKTGNPNFLEPVIINPGI